LDFCHKVLILRYKERRMKYIISLVLGIVLFTSCEKPGLEICGTIEGGEYNVINNMYYFRINGEKHWVDQKTYESFYVADYICLENY